MRINNLSSNFDNDDDDYDKTYIVCGINELDTEL